MTNDERTPVATRFPILDEDILLSLPKANKPQDLERMYTSPNSEDWVTWNLLRALDRSADDVWWPGVVAAAEANAGADAGWSALTAIPIVELWRTVASPPAYERASRQRMAESDSPAWRERAANARAVEGKTEVDLVFEGADYLVFVEAKLHSDISLNTTYDPNRNQIARNIDCVLEQAGGRTPFFWMFVIDREPDREYMRLIDLYRRSPGELGALLPHRDPETLQQVCSTLAVVTWGDLLPLAAVDPDTADVLAELDRRIDGPAAEVSRR